MYGLKIYGFSEMLKMLPLTLEELNINIPGVIGIADEIQKFKNLTKLGLYGAEEDGAIVLLNDTFEPLHNISIQELKIKVRRIIDVQPSAFSHFSKLRTFDMSGTIGLSIDDFLPVLLGLTTTNLEKLKLSHFIKSDINPELVTLRATFFENMRFCNLAEIGNGWIWNI